MVASQRAAAQWHVHAAQQQHQGVSEVEPTQMSFARRHTAPCQAERAHDVAAIVAAIVSAGKGRLDSDVEQQPARTQSDGGDEQAARDRQQGAPGTARAG
jgi:hypothetical protein